MINKSPECEVPRTKWRGQDGTESEAGKRYGRNIKKTSFFFPANMAHYVSGAVGEQKVFLVPEEGSLPWG